MAATFEVAWLRNSRLSAELVQGVVEGYMERHQAAPAALAVHPTMVEEMERLAAEVLAKQEQPARLTELKVREQRGMLVTEFWVENPRAEGGGHE